jgi:hypothetical protein
MHEYVVACYLRGHILVEMSLLLLYDMKPMYVHTRLFFNKSSLSFHCVVRNPSTLCMRRQSQFGAGVRCNGQGRPPVQAFQIEFGRSNASCSRIQYACR